MIGKRKKIENKTKNNLNTNKNKENKEIKNSCIYINKIYSNCSNFNLLFVIKLLGKKKLKIQNLVKLIFI